MLEPRLSRSRSSSDETGKRTSTVNHNHDDCSADDANFQATEGFKDVPVEDEKRKFNEDIRNVREPVRNIGQLKGNVSLIKVRQDLGILWKNHHWW